MRKKSILKLFSCYFLTGLILISCTHQVSPSVSAAGSKRGTVGVSSPHCIIYRTRSDYSMYIPVTLSADKIKIVSYLDIKDIYFNGKLSVPSLLADGFLLDNRGIGLLIEQELNVLLTSGKINTCKKLK